MRSIQRYLCIIAVLAAPVWVSAEETSLERASATVDGGSQHPLVPVIQYAKTELRRASAEIEEYSCVLIKRERIDGKLNQRQYMRVKIRHRKVDQDGNVIRPLSIYLKFLKPSNVAGREVLYVESERDGHLLARRGGSRYPNMTLELDPTGRVAMRDNLHPITELGFLNMVSRLTESMQRDLSYDDVEVKYFNNASLGDRSCRHIQVTHTDPGQRADFHLARIFVDDQWKVPVYFASYDWPSTSDGKPQLEEEYIFTDIKLNPGFSDLDFDPENPAYAFQTPQDVTAIAQNSR